MPLVSETAQLELVGWQRGLNRDSSKFTLQLDETPNCLDVDIDDRGQVTPRPGYSRFDTGPANPASRLAVYVPVTGADRIVYIEEGDGSIWHGTSTVLADSLVGLGTDANSREWAIDWTELQNFLYISSRRGNTIRFDGATWLAITDTTLNDSGTAGAPEFPQAATIEAHYNRIFAGNVFEGGTSRPSRLHWSTLTQGTNQDGGNRWVATDFIDVSDEDGQEIRKIISFRANLLIFKDNSIWTLGGSDAASFTLFLVDRDTGTTAPNSVASNESFLFFFDPVKGVHMYDGVVVRAIDAPIHDYILDGMNVSEAYRAHGWIDRDRYYLSLPWGADAINSRTFVFNMRTQAWAEYTIGWYDTVIFNDKQYTCGNKNQQGVFKFRQGDVLDNGATYSWQIDTIPLPPPSVQGMRSHRLRRVNVYADILGADVTVNGFFDGSASADYGVTLAGTGPIHELRSHNKLFSVVQFRFSFASAAATPQKITGITAMLSPRPAKVHADG